jgi:hypothetical protein
MFYNAIPIGMILKHASHTLLELLHYSCKTKTCSCNPDHPPHLSSLGRHFRPLSFLRLSWWEKTFMPFVDLKTYGQSFYSLKSPENV